MSEREGHETSSHPMIDRKREDGEQAIEFDRQTDKENQEEEERSCFHTWMGKFLFPTPASPSS